MLLSLLVGVSLTLSVAISVAVGYCLYRFSYLPFQSNRTDITALNTKIDAVAEYVKTEVGLRHAKALSDEELFRAEAAQRRIDGRARMGLISAPPA